MENSYLDNRSVVATNGTFTAQVFGWMTIGVFLTGVVAFIINILSSQSAQLLVLFSVLFFPVLIVQLILVVALSALGRRLNAALASILFIVYSLISGLTVGIIAFNYTVSSLFVAFGISSLMFLVLAVYGLVTKKDLSRWQAVALFALFGVILVSIVNLVLLLLNSPLFNGLNAILNYVVVIIFSVLIASDANALKRLAAEAEASGQGYGRYAIIGALQLYLDFVNLFIRVLSITGKRR